jgi:hypothetical protein
VILLYNNRKAWRKKKEPKGDIFEHCGFYGRWNETNDKLQYSANFSVVKKSRAIIELFWRWANPMEEYHLVSDQPSQLANHPTFNENRHDQSMLSSLSAVTEDRPRLLWRSI